MKKQVFLLFAAFLFSQAAFAYDFSAVAPSGQTLYYVINSDSTTVRVVFPGHGWAETQKPTGDLVIPDSVEGFRVIQISNRAFYQCSGLTSVTIGNSVRYISSEAFSWCTGLTSVTIGNSVYDIGVRAFFYCIGLESVSIPNSVTVIKESAFSRCDSLTSITIGSSVRLISSDNFSPCRGLTSITFLGETPPQFGDNVFNYVPTNIPVYIPCGRLAYYVANMPNFSNFVETMFDFSAVSADENRGTVQILTEPSCTNHNAVLYAVPASGYRFDHWSTGSTDNPYTLTVTTDTTIIGYFVSESGTEGIDDVDLSNVQISVCNGRVIVEGVAEEEVRVYDVTGRMVQNRSLPLGVYIVKVGTLPAQKVVVMR